ncbi:hypothetical protein [Geodermatophilus sp. SYSU D00815]
MDLATYAAGHRTALDLLSVVPLVGAEPHLRRIAATETAMAQGVLAVLAEFWAHREGYEVRVGRIRGESDPAHATVEVAVGHGRWLVLHPMAEALGRYADEVEEEGRDVDVWHVLVRGADGAIVTVDGRSVLRTEKVGLDPQAAPGVIRGVLAALGLAEAVS